MSTQVPGSDAALPKDISLGDLFNELRSREKGASDNVKLEAFSSEHLFARAKDWAETKYGNPPGMRDIAAETNINIRAASQAVALIISRDVMALSNAGSSFEVGCQRLGDQYNLCQSEPFWNQPVPTFGLPHETPRAADAATAFLVAPDLVMTAGHVVEGSLFDDMRFVFGFSDISMPQSRLTFAASDVYAPGKLLAKVFGGADRSDWALIRLTRSVKDITHLKLSEQQRIDDSAKVYVIGHPCALPMKVAGAAGIRNNSAPAFFISNLATYRGNSGSPVLNVDTFAVEGILASDPCARDFRGLPKSCKCYIPCGNDDECQGRRITRTSEFAEVVNLARSR